MLKSFTPILGLLLITHLTWAQWQPINPGAGGQVQDIVSDPSTPGHLFLASDMEGIYESIDHGLSWHIAGDLLHNRVYAVTVAPGNADQVYAGSLYGLEVSHDGGKSFEFVELTRGKSIGAIAVNPRNPNIVLAGVGWRDDYDFLHYFGLPDKSNGEIFRSTDGGKSWTAISFDNDESTDRNVFSLQFNPKNCRIVYLGAAKGAYKSTDGGVSWSKIPGPAGTLNNRGVALSPNGKVLYAAYSTEGNNGYLYATATSKIDWQQVTSEKNIGHLDFWYPEVDPRCTGSIHRVTVALQGGREGLFEGTFHWKNRQPDYAWDTIWSGTEGYDNGWDNAAPNPRFVHYTPVSWDRAIWSTTNQTIFQGVPTDLGYVWNNRYSIPNDDFQVPAWGTTWPTYSGRGTESTYTYDVAAHENYIIQGQGDNGLMESWDNGFSWSNIQHRVLASPPLSDVQAVDIGDAWGTPAVVAQATSGYGGNALNGRLYAKKLTTHSPQDEWVFLAGGAEWKGGLAPGVLRDVAVSPAQPSRVFMFSTAYGMYLLDDLGWGINEATEGRQAWVTKISNGVVDGVYAAKKIAPHPTNQDIVFFNATGGDKQGVYKGVKNGPDAEDWTWTKIYEGADWDSEVTAWEHNGQVYLYFSGQSSEAGGDGEHYIGALSLDEGETWQVVINKEIAQALRTNEWYDALAQDFVFKNKGGVVGYDNHIIMSYYDHRMQKTYGIYRGTIDEEGNVSWEDWTGDLHFGGLTSTVVTENEGQRYVYVATAGAGAWRRPIAAAALPDPPMMATALTATAVSDTQIDLAWNDNADNESGFKIERKQAEGDYRQVGSVAADVTTFTDRGLEDTTRYTYRVVAYNTGGHADYSNESSATTEVGGGGEEPPPSEPCATNLVANGEFDDATSGWEFYNNTGGEASLEVVDDAGLSGSQAAKVSISAPGAGDSDVQLYTNLPPLEGGKTYEVVFTARAAEARTIRVGVLENAPPWTNHLSEGVTLRTKPQAFILAFTMNQASYSARLDFFLGGNVSDVWVDSVVVREYCEKASGAVPETDSHAHENPSAVGAALYPNPLPPDAALTVATGEVASFWLEIIDLKGKVVLKKQVDNRDKSDLVSLTMETQLQPGLYMVRFKSAEGQWNRRLMIE